MTNRIQSLRSSVAGARPVAQPPGAMFTNFADRQLGVVDPTQAPIDLVAVRFFSTTANYVQGDYVVNGGQLYRAASAVAAGAFNPAQWTAVVAQGAAPGGVAAAAWAGTLAGAIALFPAAVVLSGGQAVIVAGRAGINDGYGGVFVYDATDTTTNFTLSGMGFVDAAGRRWNRQRPNANEIQVAWFGATLAGIQAAIAAAAALAAGMAPPTVTVQISSIPKVILPPGIIPITGPITPDTPSALNNVIIEGPQTVLDAAPGVTVFGGVGYNCYFRGFTVNKGACAFSIKTANNNATIIRFEGITTLDQTVANYRTDNNSNSSLISFDDACRHINENASANIFVALTGDEIFIKGWVEGMCNVLFASTDANFHLDRICGVPETSNGYWVLLQGVGSLFANNCRFGAEGGGGKCIVGVTTTATPWYIVLRDNQIWAAQKPWIELGAWPIYAFICKGSPAPPQTRGIHFLPGFNDAQKTSLFSEVSGVIDVDSCMGPVFGNFQAGSMMFPSQARDITPGNLLLSIPTNTGGYGASISSNHATVSMQVDIFGNPAVEAIGNNPANDGYLQMNFFTALAGLPQGPFTAVIDFDNRGPDADVLQFNIIAGYRQRLVSLGTGKHFVPVYAWYDGVNQLVSFAVYAMPQFAQFRVSGIRIIAGHVNPANDGGSWLTMIGNAAPASGYGFAGDRTINIPAVVGAPKAWRCTLQGTPGTQVSEGNL